MGYTTRFTGQFDLDKQLTLDDFRQLEDLSGTDGRDETEIGMPDAYCQWEPTMDGRGIQWDAAEKFYKYVEWLQWIIDHVLEPKGYTLSGQVAFQGEEVGDCGVLVIKEGKVLSEKYSPQDDDLNVLVRKALKEADDDGSAYWYIKEIAKKLGIE